MNVINVPIDIEIGGESFKAKVLSIGELFGHIENIIKDEKIKNAQKMASVLEGQEKTDFLLKALDSMPTEGEIITIASERIATLKGCKEVLYLATKDLNEDINEPEYFDRLITPDNVGELDIVVQKVSGINELNNSKKKPETKKRAGKK